MTKKRKNAILLMILCGVLAVAFISLTSAQTTATLTASATSDSGVIAVNGNGFDATDSVHLGLLNETDGTVVYNFTETVTTDSTGNFSANLSLPTGVYGTFNLTAHASTITAYTEYTIPQPATAIIVTPDNSNIIAVSGTGFNTSKTVALTLADTTGTTVYTFPNNTVADTQGNFNATEIIPTNLSGSYTLVASTSSATANVTISVPDLTGPTGAVGANGVAGETGATGDAGVPADTTVEYSAIVLSVVAITVATLALVKKH
jgi:hypothetical protein